MRYYSELTKKFYDSEKDCLKAEKTLKEEKEKKEIEEKKLSEERSAAAKKVETAYQKMIDSRNEYRRELSNFCDKYGYYHMSLERKNISDWLNSFWENWY